MAAPGIPPGATVDDAELHRRQQVSQRAFHRTLAQASEGGAVIDLDGDIQLTAVPAASALALLNCVFYSDGNALQDSLDEIERAFHGLDVRSWSVWVAPWDRLTGRMLRSAGYSRGAALMVTAARLDEMDLDAEDEIDLVSHPTAAMVARCNDDAHELTGDLSMAAALSGLDGTGVRAYAARHAGELACGGLVSRHGDNCYPWGLAATPAARGSVVAIDLMRAILRDALADGCETVTGEVTRAGETIGAYLGKRPIGRYDLWVRRSA